MRVLHLVKVHFDRRMPKVDSEWIGRRVDFFRRWTKASLENQTFKNFGLWASCGVNMTPADVMSVSMGTRADFVTWNPDHAPDLGLRWAAESYDYVYATRIDSDDLVSPDFMELISRETPRTPGKVESLMFRRGYLYDLATGELAVYHNPSSPFHTMMIPSGIFCDPRRYEALDYGDHSQVNERFKSRLMPSWRFTVLIHGDNFASDMSYRRENLFGVERSWSVERFMTQQPVVFDVDDLCDDWNCLPQLVALKKRYPNFKCTLFAIPRRTSAQLRRELARYQWIEVGVHGVTHSPNEELKEMPPEHLDWCLGGVLHSRNEGNKYARVFRPPGWFIRPEHVDVLNRRGFSVAIHQRDEKTLGPLCSSGYYVCGERPYWHGHTSGPGQRAHSVCGNGIAECLPELLGKWPTSQQFGFVSEEVKILPKS